MSLVVSPHAGKLETAYANVSGAHFTLTNVSSWTRFTCIRGTLTAKAGNKHVTLDAPFVGASPQDVCTAANGALAWDACDFETQRVDPESVQ